MATIDRGTKIDTLSNDVARDIIQEFNLYAGGNRITYIKNAEDDLEYVNNVQWSVEAAAALEAKNIPAVCYNEMKPARDGAVQQITFNDPMFLAVGRENSDTSLAADICDLMDYIWDKSRGKSHFIKAVENLEDMGLFVLQTYYDPNADGGKGDIKIRHIDARDIYLDPRCNWRSAQNSDRIFYAVVMSETQIKMQYPDWDSTDAQTWTGDIRYSGRGSKTEGQVFHSDFIGSSKTKYYRLIDEYKKIKHPMFRVANPNSQEEWELEKNEYVAFANDYSLVVNGVGRQTVITDEKEKQEWSMRIRQYGTTRFHFRTDGTWQPGTEIKVGEINEQGQWVMPVPGSTVQVEEVLNGQLLQEGLLEWAEVFVDRIQQSLVIGEKLYREPVVTPFSSYPFGITMLHHTDTPFPYGDARLARPVQEQINKTRSLITAYNINIASLKLFVPEGTDKTALEKQWGKAGAQFFTYDPDLGGIPIVLQFQQMSNALYEQIDRDKYLIQRMYGVYEFQDGATVQFPQTLGGTVLIDEFAQRRSQFKRGLVEEALNDLGMAIGDLIPKVYTERKIVRIVKPNMRPREVMFNQREETGIYNDLTANKYDIKMVAGSTLPTHRGARLQTALDLWDRQILRDDEAILRLTDLPDIETILQKNSIIKQAEQALQQSQELIEDLKGDMQTAERELRHADRQVAKVKFEKKLMQLEQTLKTAVETSKTLIKEDRKMRKQVNNNNQLQTK
jgi:hypothetical protein